MATEACHHTLGFVHVEGEGCTMVYVGNEYMFDGTSGEVFRFEFCPDCGTKL